MFEPRQILRELFAAAVAAVEPRRAVEACFRRDGETLVAGYDVKKVYNLDDYERIVVVGCGKAGAGMAAAVEDAVGDKIDTGLVVVKDGYAGKNSLHTIRLEEAGHPVPDARGEEVARKVRGLLEEAGSKDLIIGLISGGGSSLWPLPVEGISLRDKQEVTELLLGCGASIHEINCVRKHISAIKGGFAAGAAFPAEVVVLVMSDVVGDGLETIASGPFYPDSSTFSNAIELLEKYGIMGAVPKVVSQHLRRGAEGVVPETPKAGNVVFQRVFHGICASNSIAIQAAYEKAKELGLGVRVLTSELTGTVAEAAGWLCQKIRTELERGKRKMPLVMLSGGETTVRLNDKHGKGGRNMELALQVAVELAGLKNVVFLSAGTDGTDGPTDAAGAFVDSETCWRADALGLDARAFLARHDSYEFFRALGDLFVTGPTGTNVMDIQIVVMW